MNDDLDKVLSRRHSPSAPSNLAHRIIAAAQEKSKQIPDRLWDEIMMMFVIPRPALALGLTILIGLVAGFQAGGVVSAEQDDWASFLVIDEGDWL